MTTKQDFLSHGCSARHPQYAPHLFEPELDLLTDRHHKQLLRNGCPAVWYQHAGNKINTGLPHLQMCDEGVA